MPDVDLIALIERTDAANMAAMAQAVFTDDPSWGSSTTPIAGGQLVLSGQGLYVNRAIGVGIGSPLSKAELQEIVARSHAAGVSATVDVTPATHADTIRLLEQAGFAPAPTTTTVMVFPGSAELPTPRGVDVAVVPVSERSLDEWIETSWMGWGQESAPARRAAAAFARAAHVTDGDGMVLAVDIGDGPYLGAAIGCASLTVNGTVATLGGMSTIPQARRRGVQSVLLAHRIAVARALHATTIWASTLTGGDSERNVLRHGFVPTHQRTPYVLTRPSG